MFLFSYIPNIWYLGNACCWIAGFHSIQDNHWTEAFWDGSLLWIGFLPELFSTQGVVLCFPIKTQSLRQKSSVLHDKTFCLQVKVLGTEGLWWKFLNLFYLLNLVLYDMIFIILSLLFYIYFIVTLYIDMQ